MSQDKNVNLPNPLLTPRERLFAVVKEGRLDIIQQLIKSGEVSVTDLFARNGKRLSPLNLALKFPNPSISQQMQGEFFEWLTDNKKNFSCKQIKKYIISEIKYEGNAIIFSKLYSWFEEQSNQEEVEKFKNAEVLDGEVFHKYVYHILYNAIFFERIEIILALLEMMSNEIFNDFAGQYLGNLFGNIDEEDQKFTSAKTSHEAIFEFMLKKQRYENFVEYADQLLSYSTPEDMVNGQIFGFVCEKILGNDNILKIFHNHQINNNLEQFLDDLFEVYVQNEASFRGPLKKYLYILSLNKSVPAGVFNEFDLVLIAVKLGDKKLLENMLLYRGADPNIATNNGITALHRSINMRRNDLAFCLLDNGANPNLKNKFGVTPLMRAEQIGNQEFIDYYNQQNQMDVDVEPDNANSSSVMISPSATSG